RNLAPRTRGFRPEDHHARGKRRASLRPDYVYDRGRRPIRTADSIPGESDFGEDAHRLEGVEHTADTCACPIDWRRVRCKSPKTSPEIGPHMGRRFFRTFFEELSAPGQVEGQNPVVRAAPARDDPIMMPGWPAMSSAPSRIQA